MGDRPSKEIKKRKLATTVTEELIGTNKPITQQNKKGKFRKVITWNIEMESIIKEAAFKHGMTTAGFIKYCVSKVINEQV